MHLKGSVIKLSDRSTVLYRKQYLSREHANTLMQYCLQNTPCVQSNINMFGKELKIPRLNAWYGEFSYRYSGIDFEAQALPPPLEDIQSRLIEDTGLPFNSLLINLYRDGKDSMGWHSDNEKSLGDTPQIASVSLGAVRRFSLRHRTRQSEKHTLMLEHGSLLLMLGNCQEEWQHSLPKMRGVTEKRLNLTFRQSSTT